MFEGNWNQARSLAALQLRPPTRLLPLVQNPDKALARALRQRLQSALQALDLNVVCLDAVLPQRPRCRLDGAPGRAGVFGPLEAFGPACCGVEPGSVLLWQAPLEAWAVCLTGSRARPLVALGPQPAALVQAYNAVKVLWQVAGLQALALWMPDAPGGTSNQSSQANQAGARHAQTAAAEAARPVRALQQQAALRLGVQPTVWSLECSRQDVAGAADAASSCAPRLLETALVLEDSEAHSHVELPVADPYGAPAAAGLRGVPDVYRQRHA